MKAAILALAIALSSCIAVAQDLNSYPPEIQAALKEAEDECKSGDEDGKFTLKPGAVTKLDLTGSKRGDYIIDLEHASCSTFESVFCGTGGCLLSIFVATKSGKLKRVFSDPVRVYKISKAPGPKWKGVIGIVRAERWDQATPRPGIALIWSGSKPALRAKCRPRST